MATVRAARAGDKEHILRFTAQTFDWGDYIPEVLDDWILDQEGRLLVAEEDGRAVAILRLARPAPGQGWLEGMRVDRAYRKRGMAVLLTEAATEIARPMGLSVLRMAINETNVPSVSLATKMGFRPTIGFKSMVSPALPGGRVPGVRRAERRDVEAVLRMNHDSPSRGLGFSGWVAAMLDEYLLARHVDAGVVFVSKPRTHEGVEASAFVIDDHADGVEIANLCGVPDGVRRLLEAGLRRAGEFGFARAYATCVRGGSGEAVALAQGWSDDCDSPDESGVEFIYEKQI